MLRLGVRLLAARLRRQPASALLVILVLATAGAAGTSAVLLRSAVTGPWDRAFAATNGAHVHVASFGPLDAAALARLPGVVESSGPVVASVRELRHGGRTVGVALAAVDDELRVDRPAVVEGAWRPGGIVLERSFARALGASTGDRVEVGGVALEVSGMAVSVRNAGYPDSVPGLAFAEPTTVAALGAGGQRLTTVGLRVAGPAESASVALAASRFGVVTTAAAIREDALAETRQFQVVLASFAVLLLVAAGFLVTVLLGARLRAQRRELVLFRLVGLTPAQLVGLVAAEHAVLALAGGLAGTAVALAGGRWLAEAAATALGSTSPRPGLSSLAVTGGLVVAAAGVSATAAWRALVSGSPAARPSTAAARSLAAGLPAPVALVAKEISSSRARAAATVLAVALAVMTAVAALGMEATFRAQAGSGEEDGLRALVYGLQALLAVVALASIVAVGLVGLGERRRELAVLSAIGFSVRQLAGSTVAGQAVLAAFGALLGLPLGVAFFRLAYALANGSSAGLVDAPPLHLLAVVPAAVLVTAAVAILPASALRRLPVAAALTPA